MIRRTLLAVLASTILGNTAFAGDLTAVRISNYDGTSRIVLDLTELPLSWTKSYNDTTNTVTLNLANTNNKVNQSIDRDTNQKGVLKGIGFTTINGGLQVKLVGNQDINYHAFTLSKPERLVVDMFSDYSQKTTRNVNDSIQISKIKSTVPEGIIQASSMVVSNESPMKIINSTQGIALSQIGQSHVAAVGLKTVNANFDKPYAVSKTGEADVDKIQSTGVLRYTPSRGYFVEEKRPLLQAKAGNDTLLISAVNEPRRNNTLTLYTNQYGSSTNTNQYGYEVTVKSGKVVNLSKGNSLITEGGYVLSAHGEAIKALKTLKVGTPVVLETRPELAKIDTDGGSLFEGGTLVLKQGQYVGPSHSLNESRSLIGTTKDEKLVVAVVDKALPTSVGVTLEEGAALLSSMGAINGFELSNQGGVDITVNRDYIHKTDNQYTEYKNILLIK
ncbi:phosphodiester glycosidase family protein [Veillonella caviae]|uniref:phosphodiester glycosidase family protein n=1 Tax=Veillonella caviae TaxID=248316 RepID=UPI0023A81D34|nr:phosphodiester glycosidase family protein [Veillonella caviae]MCI5708844.1 phosphodiester glycosidase family protein [Veillonella caviae]MDY5254150.1 phosphodiester glycosidase family protein [Veillonella caviae]MDY5714530.1 phosphodiester glycosidase family protein [Veillonella caviae]